MELDFMKRRWIWAPIVVVLLLAILAQMPFGRRKAPRGGPGDEVITPLNVRDPSALVMSPMFGKQPAPTVEKPRAEREK